MKENERDVVSCLYEIDIDTRMNIRSVSSFFILNPIPKTRNAVKENECLLKILFVDPEIILLKILNVSGKCNLEMIKKSPN